MGPQRTHSGGVKMKNRGSKVMAGVFLGMFLSFLSGIFNFASSAPIVLRYSTHLPARNPITVAQVEGLNLIEKKTNGAVKFEKFYDGTLIGVRDCWEELLKGTADLVSVSAQTSPGEKLMPLYIMINNAWIGLKDMHVQLRIQKQLLKEFPEMAQEWSAVKPLSFHGIPDVNFHTKKQIRTLADFKGLQVRGIGSWPKHTVEKLGASLVAMPVTELYLALQKGIIDGVMLDNTVLSGFRLAEVTRYTMYMGGVFPGINQRMCMNVNTWKKLAPEIQKVFEETGEWIDNFYIEKIYESLSESLAFAKEKRHEFISLPPQELAKLHDLLREEAFGEAKKLDAKGLPATKIFNRVQELIRQAR